MAAAERLRGNFLPIHQNIERAPDVAARIRAYQRHWLVWQNLELVAEPSAATRVAPVLASVGSSIALAPLEIMLALVRLVSDSNAVNSPFRHHVSPRRLAFLACLELRLRLAGERICFLEVEPRADDGLPVLAGLVLDVGGGDDCTVGQQLHARVAAVAAGIAVQKLDPILAGPAVADVVIGADPGHEVVMGRTVECLVAEGDHQPSVGRVHAHVPVACQAPGRVLRLAPGLAFVRAEHHQAASLVRVLPHQAAKFLAVRRAEGERLAGRLALDLGHHAGFGPGHPAVGGSRLHRLEGVSPRRAVIQAEVAAVLQANDRAERHDALKAQRLHLLPRLATVFANNAGHARLRRENPQLLLALGIDHSIDARAVPVRLESRRQLVVQAFPSESAVVAAGHGPGRPAVPQRPDAEQRLPIRHQQRRGVALVDLLRAGGYNHVPLGES